MDAPLHRVPGKAGAGIAGGSSAVGTLFARSANAAGKPAAFVFVWGGYSFMRTLFLCGADTLVRRVRGQECPRHMCSKQDSVCRLFLFLSGLRAGHCVLERSLALLVQLRM